MGYTDSGDIQTPYMHHDPMAEIYKSTGKRSTYMPNGVDKQYLKADVRDSYYGSSDKAGDDDDDDDDLSFLDDTAADSRQERTIVGVAANNVLDSAGETVKGTGKTIRRGAADAVSTVRRALENTVRTGENAVEELFSSSNARAASESAPQLDSASHSKGKHCSYPDSDNDDGDYRRRRSSGAAHTGCGSKAVSAPIATVRQPSGAKPSHFVAAGHHEIHVDQDSRGPLSFSVSGDHFRNRREELHTEGLGSVPKAGFANKSLPVAMTMSGKAFVVVPTKSGALKVKEYPGSVRCSAQEPAHNGGNGRSMFSEYVNRFGCDKDTYCCNISPAPESASGTRALDLSRVANHPRVQVKPMTEKEIEQKSVSYDGGDATVAYNSIAHRYSNGTSLGRYFDTMSSGAKDTGAFKSVPHEKIDGSMAAIAENFNRSLPLHDLEKNGLVFHLTPSPVHGPAAGEQSSNFGDILAAYPSGSKLVIHTNWAIRMHDPDYHAAVLARQ